LNHKGYYTQGRRGDLHIGTPPGRADGVLLLFSLRGRIYALPSLHFLPATRRQARFFLRALCPHLRSCFSPRALNRPAFTAGSAAFSPRGLFSIPLAAAPFLGAAVFSFCCFSFQWRGILPRRLRPCYIIFAWPPLRHPSRLLLRGHAPPPGVSFLVLRISTNIPSPSLLIFTSYNIEGLREIIILFTLAITSSDTISGPQRLLLNAKFSVMPCYHYIYLHLMRYAHAHQNPHPPP